MPRQARTITDTVRELMTSLPEAEAFVSHGHAHFRVQGKVFGNYTINHHGDGRVALNLKMPKGSQKLFTARNPEVYFVPPYTGPKGWLGIQLDQGLDWDVVYEHAVEAYMGVASGALVEAIDRRYKLKRPTRKFRPEEINPFLGKRAKAFLKKLDAICSKLPETVAGTEFGSPVWKAGKKTFVCTCFYDERLRISVWLGSDRKMLLSRPDYEAAPYTGHNGWILIDVNDPGGDWQEIEERVLESYRHFALKRMLRELRE